jgi:hypothetical protein
MTGHPDLDTDVVRRHPGETLQEISFELAGLLDGGLVTGSQVDGGKTYPVTRYALPMPVCGLFQGPSTPVTAVLDRVAERIGLLVTEDSGEIQQ